MHNATLLSYFARYSSLTEHNIGELSDVPVDAFRGEALR